jgi:hypothetical protein
MSEASRKRSNAAAAPKRRIARRPRFIAAVRFADGRTQCFSVDNAQDHADARRMVFDELSDVAAVVISDYR